MTMTPERFRQLLDQGTVDAPPAPTAAADLASGRTRLRRHRITSVATAALAVAVIAGGVGLAGRVGSDDRGTDPVGPPTPTPTRVNSQAPLPQEPLDSAAAMAVCAGDNLPPGYFDGEESYVIGRATSFQYVLAVESADGRYWAACTYSPQDPDYGISLEPYDSQGSTEGRGFETGMGSGCPPAAKECPYYSFATLDRVSPEVHSVRIELKDGTTVTEPTERGYYVINILQRLPQGASVEDGGRLVGMSGFDFIHKISYFDGDGTPLAASYFDGSGTGEFGETVEGLPGIETYPSMKGEL